MGGQAICSAEKQAPILDLSRGPALEGLRGVSADPTDGRLADAVGALDRCGSVSFPQVFFGSLSHRMAYSPEKGYVFFGCRPTCGQGHGKRHQNKARLRPLDPVNIRAMQSEAIRQTREQAAPHSRVVSLARDLRLELALRCGHGLLRLVHDGTDLTAFQTASGQIETIHTRCSVAQHTPPKRSQ